MDGVLIAGVLVIGGIIVKYILDKHRDENEVRKILEMQSIQLPGNERIRVCAKHCSDGKLRGKYYPDIKTIYECFLRGVRVSENGPCLGVRSKSGGPYNWVSYKYVEEVSHQFGSGLVDLGNQPGQNTFIGIYSQNRPEWVYTDLACQMFSMVVVPFYKSLSPQACSFMINQVELQTIIVDSEDQAIGLLDNKQQNPTLKRIILIESISENLKQLSETTGIEVIPFTEVQARGKKNLKDRQPPKPEDMFCISYTSGTTGDPKGVILTHRTYLSLLDGAWFRSDCKGGYKAQRGDSYISYMPLGHLYERTNLTMGFTSGIQCGFFRGDVKLLLDDIQELKPAVIPCVPRILNRIYDMVMANVRSSLIKRLIFKFAVSRKRAALRRGIIRNDTIWDKLVFTKIRNVFGGRGRHINSGGASLSQDVLDFVRCTFGCNVSEAYGQTELIYISQTLPLEHESGSVGPPGAAVMVKLDDVPELGYFSENNQGEICAKGVYPFDGYFKNPEKTAEVVDSLGWLHTGDIGEWLPNGALRIIDRRKHIFKLSQGEYIAPERIENIYTTSPYVFQAFIDGNSLQDRTVGVIVPDPMVLRKWAEERGIIYNITELCRNDDVKETILTDVLKYGRKRHLKTYEQVKDIYLCPDMFTIESGLLTATMKNKRPALRKFFKNRIEELYAKK